MKKTGLTIGDIILIFNIILRILELYLNIQLSKLHLRTS